jgi:hypothetical protein
MPPIAASIFITTGFRRTSTAMAIICQELSEHREAIGCIERHSDANFNGVGTVF